MAYSIEFTLDGLPKTTNGNARRNWRAQLGEANKWKTKVIKAVRFGDVTPPSQPLTKAIVELTRYSSVEPDFDGLVSSFKHILDGLKASKVILDDKVSIIGQPKYHWDCVPRNKGFIRVKVEETT